MKAKLTICIFLLSQIGCFTNGPANQISHSVQTHPNHEGMYIVYYMHDNMINDYGPGMDEVRENIDKAVGTENKLALWDKAFAVAIPKYLDTNNLVPVECINGITIISNLRYEAGGKGSTAFRCR